MGPHDKAFRKLMKEKGVAEALLRERLPAELVATFAGPPEHLSESFVDEALKGNVADVVLRVPLTGGEDAFVYCLIEHKRTQDALVLVQVLRYLTALYAQFAKTHGSRKLPLVVPLLIYNGEATWKGPRRFSELNDGPINLKALTLDFGVMLIDVGAEPADRLSAHPTLKGGLLGLKAAATPAPQFEAVMREMTKALEGDQSTMMLLLQYLVSVAGRDVLPLLERVAEEQENGKVKAMQTISEFLESRGFRRGKKEGREEERERTLRDALRLVLRKRFKKIPAAVELKITKAAAAALDGWLEKSIDADSLRAVFGVARAND